MKGLKRLGIFSAAMLLVLSGAGSVTPAFPHVYQTGQTECSDEFGAPADCSGTGQDGEFRKGVAMAKRFTDNADGTVTDKLTGLIWLKDPSCFGRVSWSGALSAANTLRAGVCSKLADDSELGDWRLPNVRELQSLVHYGVSVPAVPNTAGTGKWSAGDPFTGVQLSNYWSSSTYASGTSDAWRVGMFVGRVYSTNKTSSLYVWPVRGGR